MSKKQASKTTPKTDKDLEDILLKDEKIIARAQIHWGIYWKAAVVFAFGLLLSTQIVELGALLGATGVIMGIYAILCKQILLLVLTDQRVFARYGLLQIDVVDIRYDKVESIELERMLPGYIMGYATVIVMGTGNRFIGIPYVGNARALRRAYNEVINQKEDQNLKD